MPETRRCQPIGGNWYVYPTETVLSLGRQPGRKRGTPWSRSPHRRRRCLSAKAFPIHEIAFPVHVQLASSDSKLQRSVECQSSDFRLPPDRNKYRGEHGAQDAKTEQTSEEPPSTQFPEGDEHAVPAVPRIRHRAVTGGGRLAGIEPVGNQGWRISLVQPALDGRAHLPRFRPDGIGIFSAQRAGNDRGHDGSYDDDLLHCPSLLRFASIFETWFDCPGSGSMPIARR